MIILKFRELLERNPVIPAIKNDTYLEEAKNSSSEVVFVIMANLINIKDIVSELKKAGKIVFVHVDMIEGLSSSAYGVEYIIENSGLDGMITTKHSVVSIANKNNIPVIQRFFILDSFSFKNTLVHIRENKPSAVEILPGIMPKIISRIEKAVSIPIIAGGLIDEKEDVINALKAGAVGISTTDKKLWES